MQKSLTVGLLLAGALFVAQPALAAKNDLSPADLAALKSYSLSMDKVNAMGAAMDELSKMPAGKQQHNIGNDSKSVTDMEAKLNAMPQVMAVYRKHGLSAHDVAVMPFALMDAGMAVAYPQVATKLSDRISPAQVAFYKQHQAELKKVKWLNGQ